MNKQDIPENWLICRDQSEWRKWLSANHLKETQVWLQIRKNKSKEAGLLLKEAVEEAICFGWIDGQMFSLDDDKYIIRMTPLRQNSKWSLINHARAEKLIADGRMTQAGMDAITNARQTGAWDTAYTSLVAPELPEDLTIELEKDPLAMKNFTDWPNNHKLQAITWVNDSRQEQTRITRIEKIVELAKTGKRFI